MSILETTTEGTFLGLMLDDELLRAEFDAIIAAEYPSPPEDAPIRRHHPGRRPVPSRRRPGDRPQAPGAPGESPEPSGRQRSPPDRT